MLCLYNCKHTHINTLPQPDGLSKVFIFFPWRGLHSHVTPFFFFFSLSQWCSSPLSVSPCDISQWAGRRKRLEEAAGAPSRFYPLLHPTSLSFVCVCALVHSHNSLLRLLEDTVWEECKVLSHGCPSTPHLPLRRALCYCAAHVTAIVPN